MPAPTPGRGWEGLVLGQSHPSRESVLSPSRFQQAQLPGQLGLALEEWSGCWEQCPAQGVPLPFCSTQTPAGPFVVLKKLSEMG